MYRPVLFCSLFRYNAFVEDLRLHRLIERMLYALRFVPKEYGLVLTADGSVDIDKLLIALNRKHKKAKYTGKEILEAVDKSEGELEITGGKIKALCRYSISSKDSDILPEYLYIAVPYHEIRNIRKNGLRSCILYSTEDSALSSCNGDETNPVLLWINSSIAIENGSKIRKTGPVRYIANMITSEALFIHISHRGLKNLSYKKNASSYS